MGGAEVVYSTVYSTRRIVCMYLSAGTSIQCIFNLDTGMLIVCHISAYLN